MTCTNKQVGILMQKIKKYNQIISAVKAGMSVKTARKYLRVNKFPSELQTVRKYRTRKDPFVKHWDEIEYPAFTTSSVLLQYLHLTSIFAITP